MCGFIFKFLLVILNIVVLLAGIGITAVGGLILYTSKQYEDILNNSNIVVTVPVVVLIIGVIITLIGFLGCCGGITKNRCLLKTYAVCVFVVLAAQVGIVIYGAVQMDALKDDIATAMVKGFNTYNDVQTNGTHFNLLDVGQNQLQCCGVYNYTDWSSGVFNVVLKKGMDVPPGCCRQVKSVDDLAVCTQVKHKPPADVEALIYTQGCFTKYDDILENKSLYTMIGGVALGVLQIICIVAACMQGRKSSV